MKEFKLKLTQKEYDTLMDVFKKMRVEEDAAELKPKKWIHDGIYLVNIETGSRINKYTKHHE